MVEDCKCLDVTQGPLIFPYVAPFFFFCFRALGLIIRFFLI